MLAELLLTATGITGVAVGLRGRPVEREKRCRKCGNDLRGTVSGRCSECGSDLSVVLPKMVAVRSKRRWRTFAIGGVALLIATWLGLWAALHLPRYYQYAPSVVYAWDLGSSDDALAKQAASYLDDRARAGRVTGLSAWLVAKACLRQQTPPCAWDERFWRVNNLLDALHDNDQLGAKQERQWFEGMVRMDGPRLIVLEPNCLPMPGFPGELRLPWTRWVYMQGGVETACSYRNMRWTFRGQACIGPDRAHDPYDCVDAELSPNERLEVEGDVTLRLAPRPGRPWRQPSPYIEFSTHARWTFIGNSPPAPHIAINATTRFVTTTAAARPTAFAPTTQSVTSAAATSGPVTSALRVRVLDVSIVAEPRIRDRWRIKMQVIGTEGPAWVAETGDTLYTCVHSPSMSFGANVDTMVGQEYVLGREPGTFPPETIPLLAADGRSLGDAHVRRPQAAP